MNTVGWTTVIKGDNAPYTTIKESNMKPTTSSLMRLAGLSAVVAGLCFLVIGMFHPLNEPSAVNATWEYVRAPSKS